MIAYIFLDEGGNFDFSENGTHYFTLTSAVMIRPFSIYSQLDNYMYDVIEFGKNIEKFHCCDDNRHIRARVFEIIQSHLDDIRVDSVIVRKCKTGPALRREEKFYSTMLGFLLSYVINPIDFKRVEEIVVITDRLPTKRKKNAFEKAIKTKLAEALTDDASYRIYHHSSSSHYGLQIADYCNWAIMRKWESGETTFYDQLKPAIKSEFDIFRTGRTKYYDDGRPV